MDASVATTALQWATRRWRWSQEHVLLAVAIALFAASVLVERVGVELGVIRPAIVVPFLSLVPGYLLVRLLRVQPQDATTELLYSLGMSLVFLMCYGLAINSLLPALVGAVFSEWTLFVAIFAAVGALFLLHVTRNEPRELDYAGLVDTVWQPWPLGLLCLPVLAVLGARLVTRFWDNTLVLAVLTLLGLLAVAAYLERLPRRYFALAVWVIAVSLLLHNSVLTHVLAWDAPKELRLATLVVDNGVWDATVGGKWMKNAMLRIVLLHPIYSLLADIELLWEFKTVSPILFSFAPVAFYKAYQAVASKTDAFVAALLPMSFFSFFTVLAWNSRTSGALLFLSLVALAVTDRSLSRQTQRILMGAFLFGIVVSHYGMAYIALAAMGLVLVGNWVLFGIRRTNKVPNTSTLVVLFFGLIVFAWYVYIVYRAGAFDRLISFSYGFFTDLWTDLLGTESVVSAEDSTTTKYVTTQYTSDTIRWLRSLNIVLGVLAAISIVAYGLRYLLVRFRDGRFGDDKATTARVEYFLYATAFLGVFGTTFVGVDKLNTARTLMPALLFFAPFVVLTPRKAAGKLADVVDRMSLRRLGKAVALVVVLSYFVLNVGLYGSATDEYHPNILIDKGRVMDDGNLAEKKYFGAMHYGTIYDLRSQEWLDGVARTGGEYHRFGSRQVIGGMYNCTGVSREPIVRQGTCGDEPALPVDGMDKVYATSGSQIYYNRTGSGNR